MGVFSIATGVTLLYDDGLLPPNAERQALAFASPAEEAKLGSEGLALKRTATLLAMEDQSAHGNVVLSAAAMESLVQDISAPDASPKVPETSASPHQSAYPYAGWANASDSGTPHPSAPAGPVAAAPHVAPSAAPVAAPSAPINVLA